MAGESEAMKMFHFSLIVLVRLEPTPSPRSGKKNIFSRIGSLFSYKSLQNFKNKLDPRKFNGAIFLGLNGPVVKSHGGIDSIGFYYSIDLCYKIVKGNLMSEIKKNLQHSKSG